MIFGCIYIDTIKIALFQRTSVTLKGMLVSKKKLQTPLLCRLNSYITSHLFKHLIRTHIEIIPISHL